MSQTSVDTNEINCQIIKGIVYNFDDLVIGHVNYAGKYSRDRVSLNITIDRPDKMLPKKKAKYAVPKKPARAIKV